MRDWTKEEDSFLLSNFTNRDISVSYIAKKLSRSELSIRTRANLLSLKRLGSCDIDAYILENINSLTIKEIAENVNRSVCTIRRRAIKIGAIKQCDFIKVTTKKIEQVTKRYAYENTFKLAAELEIPVHSIRKIAMKNKIRKNPSKSRKRKYMKSKRWTKEEEEFLLVNYKVMTAVKMTKFLNRDYNSIRHKISYMGLKDNLKIYKSGSIRFEYNTKHDKEEKLHYVLGVVKLLHKDGGTFAR